MAPLKRWLGRLLGVAVLVAAGWFAFHVAKARPRSVIDSHARILHFSDDGNTVITGHEGIVIGNFTGGRGTEHGQPPLQVWDTRSGQLLRTLLGDVERFKRYAMCAKRPLIAVALDGKIRLADWRTGKEWDVEVGRGEVERLSFAPNGDMLFLRVEGQPQPEMMIDVQRGDVVHHFESDASGLHFSADGACWRFSRNNRTHDWNIGTRNVEREYPLGTFYCDDRIFVHREPQDLSFVIRDAASMDVKSKIKPGALEVLQDRKIDRDAAGAILREQTFPNRYCAFAPSGRRVATFAGPHSEVEGMLEIWETETGKRIAAFPELKRGHVFFHHENVVVFFDQSHIDFRIPPVPHVDSSNAIIDTGTGTMRRQLSTMGMDRLWVLNDEAAVHVARDGAWEVMDVVTGETRRRLQHPYAGDTSSFSSFRVSSSDDQRYLYAFGRRRELEGKWTKWLGQLLPETTGRVQVLDIKSERIVLDLPADANAGAVMSRDCRTLLVHDLGTLGPGPERKTQGPYRFYFYDLHSWRPWLWAIAVPPALLILWLLWRRWRVRRRRNVRLTGKHSPTFA